MSASRLFSKEFREKIFVTVKSKEFRGYFFSTVSNINSFSSGFKKRKL